MLLYNCDFCERGFTYRVLAVWFKSIISTSKVHGDILRKSDAQSTSSASDVWKPGSAIIISELWSKWKRTCEMYPLYDTHVEAWIPLSSSIAAVWPAVWINLTLIPIFVFLFNAILSSSRIYKMTIKHLIPIIFKYTIYSKSQTFILCSFIIIMNKI